MVPLIVGGALAAGSIASNIYSANKAAEAADDAMEAASKAAGSVRSAWDSTRGTYTANQSAIDKYKTIVDQTYGDSKDYTDKYKALLSQDMADAIYTPTSYTYDKTVDQFYDKAWKLNNQTQLDALEASASNAGNLYSSGLLNQLASTASANANTAYKEAMKAYLEDKNLDINKWSTEERNKQAAAQQYLDQYKTKLDAYGNYIGNSLGAYGDITSATINNNNSKANTYANYVGNYANLLAQSGDYANNEILNY